MRTLLPLLVAVGTGYGAFRLTRRVTSNQSLFGYNLTATVLASYGAGALSFFAARALLPRRK